MSEIGCCAPQGAFSRHRGLADMAARPVAPAQPAPTLSSLDALLSSAGISRPQTARPPEPVTRMPESTDLATLARMAAAIRNDAAESSGYGTPGSAPRGMLVDRLG